MQFGAPYDALYQEVIQPVSHRAGFKALRADDVYRPGVILQDIIRGLVESDVIVADITPTTNPNIFYELGYAHALQKPTILLANRAQIEKLPFDVSGYRVIFYDDTIGGKRDIESTLEKHLESIRRWRA
jgi:nucleoside 2-deoxyribosyltransferase